MASGVSLQTTVGFFSIVTANIYPLLDETENGLKVMSTLHRQIVDVLDKAGTKGGDVECAQSHHMPGYMCLILA